MVLNSDIQGLPKVGPTLGLPNVFSWELNISKFLVVKEVGGTNFHGFIFLWVREDEFFVNFKLGKGAFTNYVYKRRGVGGQKNRLFVNFYTIDNVNGGGYVVKKRQIL